MRRLRGGEDVGSQTFFQYKQGKTDAQSRTAIPVIFRKPVAGYAYIVVEKWNKSKNGTLARVFIPTDGKDGVSQIKQFYGDELAEEIRFTTEIVSIDGTGRICLPAKYFDKGQDIWFVARDGHFTIETKEFSAEEHLAGISDKIKERVKEQLFKKTK